MVGGRSLKRCRGLFIPIPIPRRSGAWSLPQHWRLCCWTWVPLGSSPFRCGPCPWQASAGASTSMAFAEPDRSSLSCASQLGPKPGMQSWGSVSLF